MVPRIEFLAPKKCIGLSMRMSMVRNQTHVLWGSFMPRLKEVQNTIGSELYSIQVYDQLLDIDKFNPNEEFTKWAVVEVEDFSGIPEGMEGYELEGGQYAVFVHHGLASDFQKTFQFIFTEWLPNSDYALEHLPHFEVLGEKYKNNDPDSEEEVWIPIRMKQ